MPLGVCHCTYIAFVYEPVSTLPIILELIFSCFLILLGIAVNYRFRTKLAEEKRNRPLGRKGNVIEPIMSWFCVIQIFGFPFRLIVRWCLANQIIPFDVIPDWLCNSLHLVDRSIAFCVGYNSFFVALIRYVYIVHHHKANQWNFENVGKGFKVTSIAFPIGMEIIHHITSLFGESTIFNESLEIGSKTIDECFDILTRSNKTEFLVSNEFVNSKSVFNQVPESIVEAFHYTYILISSLIALNIVEVVLYFKVFSCIKA